MTDPFERTLDSIYRSLYVWRFFYRNTAPVLGYHFRLIAALDPFKNDPGLRPLANVCALHLLMSSRTFLIGRRHTAAGQRIARYKWAEAAFDLLTETLANEKLKLSPKSRALLCLTGFWIQQRSDSAVGAGGVQEQSYMFLRKHRLKDWREKAYGMLEHLDETDRAIALAMLTASDGDGAEVHKDLRRLSKKWWLADKPDEAIYTLRDQINKAFMASPCFWLFDATIASLIENTTNPDLSDIRQKARTARQIKLTKLKNRYHVDHPERGHDHLMRFSVQHRGWRVHAVAAARDIALIDDMINANLTDQTIARLLYQFDDYRSTGTALARFRALLTRIEIRLTVPLGDAELKEVAQQDNFFASLPGRKKA